MNTPSSVDLPEPTSEPLPLPGLIDGVITELASGTPETLSGHIGELRPTEIAELLQALPPKERQALWEEIPKSVDHAILPNLGGTARTALLNEMEEEEELFSVAEMMPESDLALILDTLPEKQTERLLQTLDEDHRTRVEQIRSFVEGSAGRIMSSDVVSVRKNVTFAVVLRWLRHHSTLPPFTDALMVVDERGHYLGRVEISDILTGATNKLVEDNLRQDGVTWSPRLPQGC
jgi:magnesium transporter